MQLQQEADHDQTAGSAAPAAPAGGFLDDNRPPGSGNGRGPRSMSLSTRLSIGFGALVVLTAVGVGLLIYRNLEDALLPSDLDRLADTAHTLAESLGGYAVTASADVHVMTDTPQIGSLFRARRAGGRDPKTGLDEQVLRDEIAETFGAVLGAHPAYLQLRLIGLNDGGREVVRVDRPRAGEPYRVVPDGELQRKGARDYFAPASELPRGEHYVSALDLNREHGVVQVPHVPVLRLAAPVFVDGERHGFVIVNVDMGPTLDSLKTSAPTNGQVYVVNEDGWFLAHPDPAKEFAFDLGGTAKFSDEFRDLTISTGKQALLAERSSGESIALAKDSVRLAGGPLATVVVTLPRAELAVAAREIGRSSLIGGGLAALFAVALALLFARSVTRPVARMSRAVRRLNRGGHADLPLDAPGEIGMLAQAFAQHAEREALFSAVFNSMSEAILTVDMTGRILTWNPAAEALYGYSKEEAIGQSVAITTPDDRQDEPFQKAEGLLEGRSFLDVETVRKTKDGRLIDVALKVMPLKAPSGKVIGAVGIVSDIGKRKQADEQFRLAVEASPTGMILVDDDGVVQLMNSECERLFGYERDEVLGKRIEMLVPDRFREQHSEERREYSEKPEAREMGAGRELFGRRKDGTEFPIEIGLNPISTPNGRLILSAIVDISERRRSEEEIAARTRELERSNAELEQFAYIASHDLREPLRMVTNYSELIVEKYHDALDEKAHKYLFYVVDGARRMQQLIDDLLTFSRVGTQGKPFKAVDANLALRRVLRSLDVAIQEAGATVEVDELPTVEADEVQLGQVFQNLIGNAIKFRSDKPPHVRIGAECRAGECVFSVADNGIGMDMSHSERIFQMFQRLHDRTSYPGSGIGLSIAKKVVERHGGRIWFESKAGNGTTFYFTMRQAGPKPATRGT